MKTEGWFPIYPNVRVMTLFDAVCVHYLSNGSGFSSRSFAQENNFLDCPKSLQSFMCSCRTACSKRQHFLVLHGNGPSLFIQRGSLTHRAPSECRRSSLHLPPSACRILAPDQTPQMTTLSPKWDAHKDIIRNVLFRRALNASPF